MEAIRRGSLPAYDRRVTVPISGYLAADSANDAETERAHLRYFAQSVAYLFAFEKPPSQIRSGLVFYFLPLH